MTETGREILYSCSVNRQWMRQRLTDYLDLVEQFAKFNVEREGTTAESDAIAADLRLQEPTVKKTLELLDPRLARFNFDQLLGHRDARNAVQRGLGILDGIDEWAVNLMPDAPTLRADKFHSWVWDSARTFWDSKHYREAVRAAATAINAHTQDKVGRRDVADNDLMNQVFTDKPKSGQTYLRLPGDPNDQTIKSRNRALRPFAEGCFAGIRNLAAHEHGPDWDEQKALEQLAALSVLARWIDDCEVKQAP